MVKFDGCFGLLYYFLSPFSIPSNQMFFLMDLIFYSIAEMAVFFCQKFSQWAPLWT